MRMMNNQLIVYKKVSYFPIDLQITFFLELFKPRKRYNNISEKLNEFLQDSTNTKWKKNSITQLRAITETLHFNPNLIIQFPKPSDCEREAKKLLIGIDNMY